jgi:hypothetical protein
MCIPRKRFLEKKQLKQLDNKNNPFSGQKREPENKAGRFNWSLVRAGACGLTSLLLTGAQTIYVCI